MKAAVLLFPAILFSIRVYTQTLAHVDDALKLALGSNPGYAVAQAAIEREQSKLLLARSHIYPQVNGFTSADYNARLPVQPVPAEIFGGEPGTYKELRFGLPYNMNAGADIHMPLIDVPEWFNIRTASAELELARTEAVLSRENICIKTVQAYFEVLASAELVKKARAQWQTATETARIADEKYQAGQNGEAEKTRASNLALSAEISYNNALFEAGNALRNLEQLVQGRNLHITDSLEAYTHLSPAALPAPVQRPSYRAFEFRRKSYTLQQKASLAGFFPTLSFSGRYAWYYQSDRPFQAQEGDITYDQALAGLRLQVPLFGGARNYALLRQTRIAAQINEWQMQDEKSRLEKEHNGILNEQQTLKANYELILRKEQAAYTAERISMKRYTEGLISFSEYAEAYYEYIQTGRESVQLAARLAYILYVPQLLNQTSDEQ